MGSDYPHIRYTFDRSTYFQYRRLMKTLESCLAFDNSEVAKFRLHVLGYYYQYGETYLGCLWSQEKHLV